MELLGREPLGRLAGSALGGLLPGHGHSSGRGSNGKSGMVVTLVLLGDRRFSKTDRLRRMLMLGVRRDRETVGDARLLHARRRVWACAPRGKVRRHVDRASRCPAHRGSSAYVAPNAVLSGDVHVGAGARILFGAVLTAEDGG